MKGLVLVDREIRPGGTPCAKSHSNDVHSKELVSELNRVGDIHKME